MIKATHYDHKGTKLTDVTLDQSVFGLKENPAVLSQALFVYQDNAHQHTSKVKTRGEINRTKAKWFKQKGTGRARHGARSAHIFVGGGVAFGPTGVRGAAKRLNQKVARLATSLALSLKAAQNEVVVISGLDKISSKTKDLSTLISKIGGTKNLILTTSFYPSLRQSAKNITSVTLNPFQSANALSLLTHDQILIDDSALPALATWLNDRKKAAFKVSASKAEATPKKVAAKAPVKEAAPKKAVKKVTKKVATKAK